MADTDLYANDLIHRFPGYSFLETIVGSMTRVQFRDGGLATVAEATTLVVIDAYKHIREDMLDGQPANFISTTAERDALTGLLNGTQILNDDTYIIDCFDDATWYPTGRAQAYGSMYEDNSGGSTLVSASSYSGWVTATAGVVDGNSIVTFNNNSTADYLGVSVGGDYKISFHASFTNAGGNLTTAAIFVDNNERIEIKDTRQGDSAELRNLVASGILTLADNDEVDLRFHSSSSDDIDLFQVSVSIERL